MRLHVGQLLLTVATLVALGSCGGSPSPMPAPGPVAPTPPSPLPEPPPPAPPRPGVTLSGGVFEVLPGGTRRPIGARQVSIEVEVPTTTDPQRGGWVRVDADGRYRLSNVPDGRFVKVEGVDLINARPRYQFCATNTITNGDTVLDIVLFLPGVALPTPTLSGQVSAVIDGKRVPVAGADVYYQSRAFGPDVVGGTDSDGRFSLCGIPPFPGELYMFCSNDETAYSRKVMVHTDTVIDIDATTFRDCLLLPTVR